MKPTELLKQQTGAEETNAPNKPSSKWNRVQITNSPFWIIGNAEDGYNITMGKYKINQNVITEDDINHYTKIVSNLLETHDEKLTHAAQTWLTINQWDVVLSIALCAYTDMKYRQDDTDERK